MLEGVDGLVSVETRKARLTLGLSLGINRRERQQVILVAETPNGPYIKKRPLWSDLHSEEREKDSFKINIMKKLLIGRDAGLDLGLARGVQPSAASARKTNATPAK